MATFNALTTCSERSSSTRTCVAPCCAGLTWLCQIDLAHRCWLGLAHWLAGPGWPLRRVSVERDEEWL
jgi:hypothetical protein